MTILKFRLIRNLSWMTLEHGFRLALGVVVGALVARHLGPSLYGVLNYAGALVAIFATVSSLVPESLIVRELIAERKETARLLTAAFVVRVLGASGAYALVVALTFSLPASQTERAVIVHIIGITLFFQSVDVFASWFQSHQNPRPVVFARMGGVFLASLLRLLLVWSDAPVIGFAVAIVIESALIAFFLSGSIRLMALGKLVTWPPSFVRAKRLLHDGWPLFLSAISATLYLRLDLVMIGLIRGEYEAGIYSAATRISEIWYFLPMSVAVVVQPLLLQKRQLGGLIFREHMVALYAACAWAAVCLALLTSFLAKELVMLLFGQQFNEATAILQIHAWAAIPVFLGVASTQFLIAENLVRLSWYRTTIGLLTNVLLNLVLIPEYGGEGAAWATVVSYFVATFSLFFFPASRDQASSMLLAMTPAGLVRSWCLYKEYRGRTSNEST